MPDHPFGAWSLAPPLVAIVLAIATRHAAWSLLAGVAAGAVILAKGNVLAAVPQLLETHLWSVFANDDRLRVFAFTLLMGAMVGVIGAAGGMRGLVDAISPLAKNRRRGQLATWLLGLVIFFDDYANTMLLGSTLRPLCDRLRISREKLAYLVDSTSAPVAGLALVSTWVAGEIGFVQAGIDQLDGVQCSAFDLFFRSIPYRFYVWWALVFVFLVAVMRRDFGPMYAAEMRTKQEGATPTSEMGEPQDASLPRAHWLFAVVPVVVTVAAIVALLINSGQAEILENDPEATPTLMETFGQADSYRALLWGSLAGLAVAVVMSLSGRLLSARQVSAAAGVGASHMLPALVILWLASSLSAMTGNQPTASDKHDREIQTAVAEASEQPTPELPPYAYRAYRLYTGDYLGQQVAGAIAPWLLPTVVFLLASGVAFATGTSWGTMGIVMPIAVPLAYGLLAGDSTAAVARHPIMLATIGSVLAGSIFGDHCSPISDTTVLSSQASGCDHIAHVWTQLPYALLVGGAAIVCGTLPIGLGMSVWIAQPLGIAVLVAAMWMFGRRTE